MNLVKKDMGGIPENRLQTIELRYKRIINAIGRDFCGDDDIHCGYVGSYGRGTAIETSDIDILVQLPYDEYERFNKMKGNNQSRLLATVRNAVLETLPTSDVRADGQVVKIQFSDGIKFEILPVFKSIFGGQYIYPDTNMGGNWFSTNPFAEQHAMNIKNAESSGLLKDTCKHIRSIRDKYFSMYHLSGIVIDSFVYAAIGYWFWDSSRREVTEPMGSYEKHLLKRFYELRLSNELLINAPGSNDYIETSDSIACLEKVLKNMAE